MAVTSNISLIVHSGILGKGGVNHEFRVTKKILDGGRVGDSRVERLVKSTIGKSYKSVLEKGGELFVKQSSRDDKNTIFRISINRETVSVSNGSSENKESFFINGVKNKKEDAVSSAKLLTDTLGRDVTLIYNDTRDYKVGRWGKIPGDFLNAFLGKLHPSLGRIAESHAVNALVDQFKQILVNDPNKTIDVHAHSQGAVVLENALAVLQKEMGIKNNLTWEEMLKKRFIISLYGPAEQRFRIENINDYRFSCDAVPIVASKIEQNKFVNSFTGSERTVKHSFSIIMGISHSFDAYLENFKKFYLKSNQTLSGEALADKIVESIIEGDLSDKTHSAIIDELLSNFFIPRSKQIDFSSRFLELDKEGMLGKFELPDTLRDKMDELVKSDKEMLKLSVRGGFSYQSTNSYPKYYYN